MHTKNDTLTEQQQNWAVEALFKEWESLRTESLQAISARIQIVNFAFVAVGVFLGGLATSKIGHAQVAWVCLIPLPFLAFATAFIWLGEHYRSQRAGRAAALVEEKLNCMIGQEEVINWETRLKDKNLHMTFPYVSTYLLIFGLAVLAQTVGILSLDQLHSLTGWARFANTASHRHWAVASVAVLSIIADIAVIGFWKKCEGDARERAKSAWSSAETSDAGDSPSDNEGTATP
jgi:hypothetical protein